MTLRLVTLVSSAFLALGRALLHTPNHRLHDARLAPIWHSLVISLSDLKLFI